MIGIMPAASAARTPGSESSSTTQWCGVLAEALRGGEEDVGRRLAARDLVAADQRGEARAAAPSRASLAVRAVAPRRGRHRLGNALRLEPVEELEQAGLQRDAFARDDRVVGDVPGAS